MAIIKDDLARYISAKIEIPKADAMNFAELILSSLKEIILIENNINIMRVGRFVRKKKKERNGRNPYTGESLKISERDVILFYASDILRNELNGMDIPRKKFNYSTYLSKYIYKKIQNIILNVEFKFINDIVNAFFECINFEILKGERIEIRGFGSFTLRVYESYYGINPKNREKIFVKRKILPFFKYSKNIFY